MERALGTGEGEGSGRPFIVGMPTEVFGPWSEPWPQVRGRGQAGPLLRACPLRCSGHGASPGHRWGGGGVGQATEGWGGQDMRQPPVEWGGGRRGLPRQIYAPLLLSPLKAVRGDAVRSFDELSAARGGLGRFPGSEVMTLLKQFAGVGRVAP